MGKQYEPILTTRDGLWRYQLGDILSIIGFIPESNSPIFKFAGRKSSVSSLPRTYGYPMTALKVHDSPPTCKHRRFSPLTGN